MIDKNNISEKWIEKVSENNLKANKMLIEKVIWAFLLLEGLCNQKLSFIFKGGTSLMLHLKSARRFSIDIDIIYSESQESLEAVLDKVVYEQGFIRKEIHFRNVDSEMIKAHYKFYYPTSYGSRTGEGVVLLDVLFENNYYTNVMKLPIQSKFVPEIGDPIEAIVPSKEDLLGDKLTAFAPGTTGIPYMKRDQSMSLEIIKQLYDIGSLFDFVKDVSIVSSTFKTFAEIELRYREKNELKYEDVLTDIFETSLCISSEGNLGKGNIEELRKGIKRIEHFIYSERFNIETAKIMASKVAYLVTLIKSGLKNIGHYSTPQEVIDWKIENTNYGILQRLKRTNPEAFFYWYKALNMQ